MRTALLEVLRSPGNGSKLALDDRHGLETQVQESALEAADGRTFRIRNGVPRMAPTGEGPDEQEATRTTFDAKGRRSPTSSASDWRTPQHRWFEQQFGFDDEAAVARELGCARWIIDAGTGPGIQPARLTDAQVMGMDLSTPPVRAQRTFGARQANLHYVQGDILELTFAEGELSFVVADRVLHDTLDCPRASRAVASLVRPEGKRRGLTHRRRRRRGRSPARAQPPPRREHAATARRGGRAGGARSERVPSSDRAAAQRGCTRGRGPVRDRCRTVPRRLRGVGHQCRQASALGACLDAAGGAGERVDARLPVNRRRSGGLEPALVSLVRDPIRRTALDRAGREFVLRRCSYEATSLVWERPIAHVWRGEPLPEGLMPAKTG